MGNSIGASGITRAISDGTGLSGQEIGLLLGGVAAATVLIAGLRAAIAFRDLWPKTRLA